MSAVHWTIHGIQHVNHEHERWPANALPLLHNGNLQSQLAPSCRQVCLAAACAPPLPRLRIRFKDAAYVPAGWLCGLRAPVRLPQLIEPCMHERVASGGCDRPRLVDERVLHAVEERQTLRLLPPSLDRCRAKGGAVEPHATVLKEHDKPHPVHECLLAFEKVSREGRLFRAPVRPVAFSHKLAQRRAGEDLDSPRAVACTHQRNTSRGDARGLGRQVHRHERPDGAVLRRDAQLRRRQVEVVFVARRRVAVRRVRGVDGGVDRCVHGGVRLVCAWLLR
mmetsp:Transcript_14306/g.27913  ORF Transcript_14306/g.27913 Transcript_14306/m.27913 type:complete len:279 (-) Transcript_14306:809-1645(-)